MPKPNTIHSTTQEFLDIYDIVNDILILKDGSAALILGVDAVNFGLLAEAEQDAIIYSYAGLLNSLNYPVQILIVSKTKDVSNYLRSLEEQENNSLSETKKRQIREYRQFVSELIRERNVLDKKFYAVVPASALELGLLSAQSVIPGVKPKAVANFDRSIVLDKAITNLYPKRDHLAAQFARIGLYARQLNTQEIIQLFYNSYNPEATEGQEITDSNSYTTPLVETISKGETMVNANIPNNPSSPAAPAAPTPVVSSNPVAPTTTMPSPAPTPTPTSVDSTPPAPATMPTPIAPAPTMPGTAPAATPPAMDGSNDAQSAINNTVQEMGSEAKPADATNPTPGAAPATPAPAGNTPPPLPEI